MEGKLMLFKRKIRIPTGDLQEIECIDTWIVSWWKRTGEYSYSWEKCYQAFANKDEAIKLKDELKAAFKLIGDTYNTEVSIERQITGI
jgi:hypothetical protein